MCFQFSKDLKVILELNQGLHVLWTFPRGFSHCFCIIVSFASYYCRLSEGCLGSKQREEERGGRIAWDERVGRGGKIIWEEREGRGLEESEEEEGWEG